MTQWSDIEQLMLELVNRARLDPFGEAARFGIPLNQGLATGTLTGAPMQPLAGNGLLVDAARAHSQWMLATDTFSHTGGGGSDPGDRMAAAGYAFTGAWTWAENIAWQGSTGNINVTAYIVDEHENLFLSPGHRENILNPGLREIGVGASTGTINGYNALMTTQAFATSGSKVFITGVAYTDKDGDGAYDIGEARSAVSVVGSAGSTTASGETAAAGGYALGLPPGLATVTFSGSGISPLVTAVVDARAGNVKVDLIGSGHIASSAGTTLGAGASGATLLGAASADLTGNGAANLLTGSKGRNTINGGDGNDTMLGGLGNDWLWGGHGADSLSGGSGNDCLYGQNGNDSIGAGGGNDTLNGGAGMDSLWGGAGQDRFVFSTTLGAANVDRVADFVVADDTIALDDVAFAGFAAGMDLAETAFVVGSVATTAAHRIIHDRATGALYFDVDGAGGVAAVKFATITAGLMLTADDFVVV